MAVQVPARAAHPDRVVLTLRPGEAEAVNAWEEVHVVGGPLDGTDGTIRPESSQLGFFVHVQGEVEDETWFGYYDHGERTGDGRRIFKPGPKQ